MHIDAKLRNKSELGTAPRGLRLARGIWALRDRARGQEGTITLSSASLVPAELWCLTPRCRDLPSQGLCHRNTSAATQKWKVLEGFRFRPSLLQGNYESSISRNLLLSIINIYNKANPKDMLYLEKRSTNSEFS